MDTLTPPITVMTVDDHPVFLQGLASAVAAEPGLMLLGQVSSGAEAVALHARLRPDVTLMDLQMPGMGGVEAIRQIRQHDPDARIVALTMLGGDMHARRAIVAGASGYLLKNAVRRKLFDTVREVHHGRRRMAPEVAQALADTCDQLMVSRRELDVLAQVARGRSNPHIGAVLGISHETVKAHMRSILAKLAARDRTHAVLIALRRGLLDLGFDGH